MITPGWVITSSTNITGSYEGIRKNGTEYGTERL